MVADAEAPGIGKAAVAVEADVALKQHRPEAQGRRPLQGVVQQLFAVALALQLRRDADGAHGQHGDHPAVVGVDDRAHEHVLSDQRAVLLHDEVQLPDKGRILPEHMDHIVLQTARAIDVPKCFAHKIFDCSVVLFFLQADGIVIWIHGSYLNFIIPIVFITSSAKQKIPA